MSSTPITGIDNEDMWGDLREMYEDLSRVDLGESSENWTAASSDRRGSVFEINVEESTVGLSALAMQLAWEGQPLDGDNSAREGLGRSFASWVFGGAASHRACSAVVANSGDACTARASAADADGGVRTTCGRHAAQDLLPRLLAAARSFPRSATTQKVRVDLVGRGSDPRGDTDTIMVCGLCPRAVDTTAMAQQAADLGDGTDFVSKFSHCTPWLLGVESEAVLEKPGSTFCLSCATLYPRACLLLACLKAASIGEEVSDHSVLVWSPPPSAVGPDLVDGVRRNALTMGLALPAAWAKRPSAANAAAVLTGVQRSKEGTNTALREKLARETAVQGDVTARNLVGAFGAGLSSRADGQGGGAPRAQERPMYGSPELEDQLALIREERAQHVAEVQKMRADNLALTAQLARLDRREAPTRRTVSFAGADLQDISQDVSQVDGQLVRSLLERLETLEAKAQSPGNVMVFRALVPDRPRHLLPPSETDSDGFAASSYAHQLSTHRAGWEDYLGMQRSDRAYGRRRNRMGFNDRIDIISRHEFLPEETGADLTSLEIDEVTIKGTSSKRGIPNRGDVASYQQARMTDLGIEFSDSDGIFKSATGELRTYAEFELRIMLARYQFLSACERVLMDDLRLGFGVAWRYLTMIVTRSWQGKEVTEIGVNRDLLLYAMRTPMTALGVRTAPMPLVELASARIHTLWLAEAQRLAEAHEDQQRGNGGGSSGAGSDGQGGGGGGAGAAIIRCFACGSPETSCGGYRSPGFQCGKAVRNACNQTGCSAKHLSNGPRRWSCKQAASAVKHLQGNDLTDAFRAKYDAFVSGPHAKAGAVRADA